MNVLYVFSSDNLTPALCNELSLLFDCDPNAMEDIVFLDAMRTSNSRIPEARRAEGLCINQVVCMFRRASDGTYQLENMAYSMNLIKCTFRLQSLLQVWRKVLCE